MGDGTALSLWVPGVVLLWKGDGGMMPDKSWWKEQEDEKSFPALQKKAKFCDMSLINV